MHIPPFYPAVEIPDVSLTEFILERAKQFGDKPAFIDGPTGRSISFSELGDQIGRVAGALRERGFGKGDVAAIYSPNVMEYAIVFHAAATLGGAVTTANPLYTAEEQYQDTLLDVTDARVTRYRDSAELFRALGGGWWNADTSPLATPDDATTASVD